MIANPRLIELLTERTEYLKLMQDWLMEIRQTPPGQERVQMIENVKILGSISQKIKEQIEQTEREGLTEKEKQHYKILEFLKPKIHV